VTRNVVGCPVGGVDPEELIDPQPLVREISDMLLGNRDFYDLPRKFKICITGCKVWCPYPEINDIGLTPVVHPDSGEVGFSLRVGGGLSTTPHLAVKLNAWVRPREVCEVVRGITEVFRDSEVLRMHRERARMKFLFLREGWTAESFQQELEKRIGYALHRSVPEEVPGNEFRDHVGVHRQKQKGLNFVGLSVFAGRLNADQMQLVADVAEHNGDGTVRTTVMQNLVLLNIPDANVNAVRDALADTPLLIEANPFRRGTIACTGMEFCKLAITETKALSKQIANHLAVTIPEFNGEVKVHVTGCPNSCGQHWIADLGLQGGRDKGDEAYDFFVGGGLGQEACVARRIGVKVKTHEVKFGAEKLVRAYHKGRENGQSFKNWSGRHTDDELAVFTLMGPLESNALRGMISTYERWKIGRESVPQFLCRYGMVGG